MIITIPHSRRVETNCDVCPITVFTLFYAIFQLHLSIFVFYIILCKYANVTHAMVVEKYQVLVVVCFEFWLKIVSDMISSFKSIGIPSQRIPGIDYPYPFLFLDS